MFQATAVEIGGHDGGVIAQEHQIASTLQQVYSFIRCESDVIKTISYCLSYKSALSSLARLKEQSLEAM